MSSDIKEQINEHSRRNYWLAQEEQRNNNGNAFIAMIEAGLNKKPDNKIVSTYRLTDGSDTFDTRRMTEEEAAWANNTCKVATGHKENPWFWEKIGV